MKLIPCEIKGRVSYDPITGMLIKTNGRSATGKSDKKGYLRVCYNQKQYLAHRVAWFIQTGNDPGKLQIDHINGNKEDNRWCNIRTVDNRVNCMNQKRPKNNTSGTLGVCWHRAKRKWISSIKINYKTIQIGAFDSKEEAVKARLDKQEELNFHDNHGRIMK